MAAVLTTKLLNKTLIKIGKLLTVFAYENKQPVNYPRANARADSEE